MDFSTDINLQVLHQLSTQFLGGKLPDYVNVATLRKKEAKAALPPSAFGDPGKSSFPCDSRDSTFLSQLFFHGTHANGEQWDGSLPREVVGSRLDKAAEFWGIAKDVQDLQGRVKSASAPPQLTDADYALIEQYGGSTIRRFPVISAPAVKMSCARFCQQKVSYPYAWRQKAAQCLLSKAAAFQVTSQIPQEQLDYMMKACGFVPAPDRDVAVQLMYRAQIAGSSDSRQALEKLARAVNSGEDSHDRVELCGLIDKVDRQLKLFRKYASGLPMPEQVCFTTGIQKQASLQVCLGTGKVYDMDDLGKVGIEPYGAISKDLARELAADDTGALNIEKAAEILPTLPRDQAVILDKAFEAVGVRPRDAIAGMQVKQAANQGNMNAFNLDEWYKFARERGHGVHENFRFCLQLDHPQRVIPTSADSGKQGLVDQHAV